MQQQAHTRKCTNSASPRARLLFSAAVVPLLLLALLQPAACSSNAASTHQHLTTPTLNEAQPPVWPEQFTATMLQNRTNRLALVTLVYDWKLKANLNIISSQLGAQGTVWDLEHDNGTSFIFSRDQPVCKTLHFDVGILTPDWLKDSKYLGQTATDNFVTDVWTKAKFLNYYADKDTGRPVRWTFLWSGAEFHTMQWDEGATLSKEMWQAPAYCFNQPAPDPSQDPAKPSILDNPIATGRMLRLEAATSVQQEAAAAAAAAQHSKLRLQGAEQADVQLPSS